MKDYKNQKEKNNQTNSEQNRQENMPMSINNGKLCINLEDNPQEENIIRIEDTNNFSRIILNKNQLESQKDNSYNENGYENYSGKKTKNGKSKSANNVGICMGSDINNINFNHQKENCNSLEQNGNLKGTKIVINFGKNEDKVEDRNLEMDIDNEKINPNNGDSGEIYDKNEIGYENFNVK